MTYTGEASFGPGVGGGGGGGGFGGAGGGGDGDDGNGGWSRKDGLSEMVQVDDGRKCIAQMCEQSIWKKNFSQLDF